MVTYSRNLRNVLALYMYMYINVYLIAWYKAEIICKKTIAGND